jgi:hypothetical protein
VLQVGLRHAPIPGPSQAKGTDPLGERLSVTACNRNGPGLQSARFQAHITCLYPSPPAPISCL